jgi:hypothetical protein
MTFCSFLSKASLPNSAYISNFYDGLARLTNTTLFNSTDLQIWQDLGATNADTNGNVQFLDTNAALFSHRFYLAAPQ